MQAIRVHNFGGLDALVAETVPRPAPGDGEVLSLGSRIPALCRAAPRLARRSLQRVAARLEIDMRGAVSWRGIVAGCYPAWMARPTPSALLRQLYLGASTRIDGSLMRE